MVILNNLLAFLEVFTIVYLWIFKPHLPFSSFPAEATPLTCCCEKYTQGKINLNHCYDLIIVGQKSMLRLEIGKFSRKKGYQYSSKLSKQKSSQTFVKTPQHSLMTNKQYAELNIIQILRPNATNIKFLERLISYEPTALIQV